MKKTNIIAIIALLVAVAGAAVAVAAYLKKRGECTLCNDFDNYDELDCCDDDCCFCCCDDENKEDSENCCSADEPISDSDAE